MFLDYDQVELDASYDQVSYEPLIAQVSQRLASNVSGGAGARRRLPRRAAWPCYPMSKSWILSALSRAGLRMHSGRMALGRGEGCRVSAEMFVNAGAHYVALDFRRTLRQHQMFCLDGTLRPVGKD